jgi:catechol 2,3-dioxygenase-like lactoylglutathione lyase family enzyme
MLHHVSVGVADVARAATFYDAVLGALGYKRIAEYLPHAVAYGETRPRFWVQTPVDAQSASVGNGAHIGFMAKTKEAIDAFHRVALELGGADNGAPGPRPDYGPEYYGAFVIDPDGNKIEATLFTEPAERAQARKKRAAKKAMRTKTVARKAAKKAGKKLGQKPGQKGAKRPGMKAKLARKAKGGKAGRK